jgi:hypothetical protein
MANFEVTLKRVIDTSGNTDVILPTTTMNQIFTDTTLATNLSTYLGNTFIPLSQKGSANGVVPLDANSKIDIGYFPNAIFDNLKFIATVTTVGGQTTLRHYADHAVGQAALLNRSPIGLYFLVNLSAGLTVSSNPTAGIVGSLYYITNWDITDAATVGTANSMEQGDWFIVTGFSGAGTVGNPYVVNFASVENTYELATEATHGIVRLAPDSLGNLTGLSGYKEVITIGNLVNLIGTDSGQIADGGHLHDSRYYTETEIGNFFSGSASITGYNKSNWDTAYGWGNHAGLYSALGHTHDDRYYTESEIDTKISGHVPVLYGANPTSNVVGAILIDQD